MSRHDRLDQPNKCISFEDVKNVVVHGLVCECVRMCDSVTVKVCVSVWWRRVRDRVRARGVGGVERAIDCKVTLRWRMA
jgi:hypothetical protein